ncbi:hypothetical protein PR048_007590 [Dryococelus australis]|uniref:Mutator-like transposase domain-containing protein n=1 Tax=Dryococelus australis TaxID=614101 RepID=A0ABQ9HUN2_9NEOP|nr:hypothetical protein PR048_007590 [Dryococelus australis]
MKVAKGTHFIGIDNQKIVAHAAITTLALPHLKYSSGNTRVCHLRVKRAYAPHNCSITFISSSIQPCPEGSLPPLPIETQEPHASSWDNVKGNGIFSPGLVIPKLLKLQIVHMTQFTLGTMEFKKEIRNGLHCSWTFECDTCHRESCLENEEAGPDVLNNAGAWAALTSGIGFSQIENILGTLDVPSMNHNTFLKNESFVEKVWLEHVEKSISEAGKEERLLAEEKDNVDSDGAPSTTVIVDGWWSKMSFNGHKNNASSGCGTSTHAHEEWTYQSAHNGPEYTNCGVYSESEQLICNWSSAQLTSDSGIYALAFCKVNPRENPPSCGIIPVRFPHAKAEVAPPRIEPGSPWWVVSGLVTRLQRLPKAVIIGELIGKLLFLGVRNEYCSLCGRAARQCAGKDTRVLQKLGQ